MYLLQIQNIQTLIKLLLFGKGTRQFLRDTSFSAVGSDMLLNENDENKIIIQQAIMSGLNKGIVKPFRSHVLSAPFTSDKVFATMR